MDQPRIVVLTDHSSREGSRPLLEAAVLRLTSQPALSLDARNFMIGGNGWIGLDRGRLALRADRAGPIVRPSAVIVYEIPPLERHRIAGFQDQLRTFRAVSLATDAAAWRDATDKRRMVRIFEREGISQMESVSLTAPTAEEALRAFERLGSDVWARPSIGSGGSGVAHVTSAEQLHAARLRYAAAGDDWLITRDARNIDVAGRRRQLRVVVLGDRVLRVVEHVQADPDAPCNECRGARVIVHAVADVAPRVLQLAVAATRALRLPFGGVDVATSGGGVVFEVNVHPVIVPPTGLAGVAVPYVQAHLDLLADRAHARLTISSSRSMPRVC